MNTARNSATPASSSIHSISACLRKFAIAAVTAVLAGCITPPSPPAVPAAMHLRPAAFVDLPGWNEDAQQDAWPSFNASCSALMTRQARVATWNAVCASATMVDGRDPVAVRAFFERHFSAYQVLAADGEVTALVTGYYEPLLRGSRLRDERNRYPLYAPPDDLLTVDLAELYPELKDKRVRARVDGKRVVPYWTRAEIEMGKAPVAGKELLFVDDPVEAFLLQIQGSGRVQLPDGGIVRVGYADQNGQPYRSIGRVLVDRGELTLDKSSMQGITQWAREHADALSALLAENPSYVFFREVPANPSAVIDGPAGALGVPLAAGRAIAVDSRFIPLGTPVFLATRLPSSSRPFNRLVLAQDTGGAIRGPLRADLFCGFGEQAADEAGRMREQGRMWLLWPKGAPLPTASATPAAPQ